MEPWQERTSILLGEETLEKLADSKVMVVGNSELGSADKIKLFRIKKPYAKYP